MGSTVALAGEPSPAPAAATISAPTPAPEPTASASLAFPFAPLVTCDKTCGSRLGGRNWASHSSCSDDGDICEGVPTRGRPLHVARGSRTGGHPRDEPPARHRQHDRTSRRRAWREGRAHHSRRRGGSVPVRREFSRPRVPAVEPAGSLLFLAAALGVEPGGSGLGLAHVRSSLEEGC